MNSEDISHSAGQFLRFSIIGVIGFAVDSAALLTALQLPGVNLYSGRVISFLIAATATWALNRRFTFAIRDKRPLVVQWARFVGANAIGGAVNYGVYAALVTYVPLIAEWPVMGVGAGSIAGLAFNFSVSKFWVFRAG